MPVEQFQPQTGNIIFELPFFARKSFNNSACERPFSPKAEGATATGSICAFDCCVYTKVGI